MAKQRDLGREGFKCQEVCVVSHIPLIFKVGLVFFFPVWVKSSKPI